MSPGQAEMDALGQELARSHFTRLYREHGRAVLGYALRRVADPEDAADVVAETFLVAWRRLDDVPSGEESRLWLFGVARLTLSNSRRSEKRRTRLGARLAESLRTELSTHEAPPAQAVELLRAIGELDEEDRELLLLVSWEELSAAQAAKVLGVSSTAVRSRLHRSRRRLRKVLEEREREGEG